MFFGPSQKQWSAYPYGAIDQESALGFTNIESGFCLEKKNAGREQ
jgi:hypothetical protein